MSEHSRADIVVLLVVWVLPLLAASGLLAAAGLPVLAAALLVVEVAVAAAVWLARRRPARTGRAAPAWVVPAAMVAVLVAILGLAALAAAFG